MPLSDSERLRYLQLKKKQAESMPSDTAYLSNQIKINEEPGQPSFIQGIKAGLTAQPGEGVGHFIGSMIPAGVGAALTPFAPPVGAALGEAARQTAGSVVNPEAMAQKSPLSIGAEVAGAGISQKAGEMAGPVIGKGITKAGEAFKSVTDWFGSKVGKSFLKASEKIQAYGAKPEQAIKDENIIATTWDNLADKIGSAKESISYMYGPLFEKATGKEVSLENALTPINSALREAKKYPETNKAIISAISKLKRDFISRVKSVSKVVEDYEFPPSKNIPENWNKDIANTFNPNANKGISKISKEIVPENQIEKKFYKSKSGQYEEAIDAEFIGKRLVTPVKIANDLKKEMYELAEYKGTAGDEIALNKVKQYVASAINKEVEKAVPDIAPINSRLHNLFALETAVHARAVVAERNDVFGLPEMFATGIAGVGGVMGSAAGLAPAAGLVLGSRALKTPIGATATMQAAKGAGEIFTKPQISFLASKISEKFGGALSVPVLEKMIEEIE